MTSTVVWVVLALVATGCAIYVARTARPVQRQAGESWLSLYFRVYWNPGTAAVIALYSWATVLGVRVFAEEPSAAIFVGAIGMLILVTVTAALDRSEFGTGRTDSRDGRD